MSQGPPCLDAEWEKLRMLKRPSPNDKGQGAWDETMVREAAGVRAEARKKGDTVHFGENRGVVYGEGNRTARR